MYNNKPIHIMYHIIPEVFHKCMLFTKVIDVKEKSFTYILNLNINKLTFIICKTMLEYDLLYDFMINRSCLGFYISVDFLIKLLYSSK